MRRRKRLERENRREGDLRTRRKITGKGEKGKVSRKEENRSVKKKEVRKEYRREEKKQ